jgi:chemotaxis response regulator CheB
MQPRVRVLVVDDSPLSREALKRLVSLDGRLEVVGEASTGEEALALAATRHPDLVTMDLQMPGMGGLKAIEQLMAMRPTAVVVISEKSSGAGIDWNAEALSRGALELMPKSAVFGPDLAQGWAFSDRLVRLAQAFAAPEGQKDPAPRPAIPISGEAPLLVGVGASTGGPRALARLLSLLPAPFPLPLVLVQHMADDFFDSFVRFLREASGRPVELAQAGQALRPGDVVVAPPRRELFVREGLTVRLLPAPAQALISPSVDSLFFSLAGTLKGRGVGVLLTGMGDDGAQGLLRMRRMGARTVAQDRATSAVYGMPRVARELGAAELVLALDDIAGWLTSTAATTSGEVLGGTPGPPGQRPAPSPPHRPPRVTARPPGARRVLLADASGGSSRAELARLMTAGYQVRELNRPREVLRALQDEAAELVLLDCEAEGGQWVAEALAEVRRAGFASLPVLLLSGEPAPALQARARAVGAVGFVRRGDAEGLLSALASFLG